MKYWGTAHKEARNGLGELCDFAHYEFLSEDYFAHATN
jgi:hypothetical protein